MTAVIYVAQPDEADLMGESLLRAAHELKNALGRKYSPTYEVDLAAALDKVDEIMDFIEEKYLGNE